MRFSPLQEESYGVGLPQDRIPDHADKDMMATDVGSMELVKDNSLEEGSMVSNLPLLFANGYPTSLEKITLAQLERFITFMVQCSLGQDSNGTIDEPQWWPKEVKFSNPLVRPKKVTDNWVANLKKLVFRCYTYHRSEYLLRFCSYLARYPHEELEYINNWDSTTSLYHKSTGKLLVTFRNENMNYDKKVETPRKTLLSHNGIASGSTNKSKSPSYMVQPPCEDIYLCDNCDAEVIGFEKMKEHERICCEQQECGSNDSRSTTPDLLSTTPELGQNQFLEYFKLRVKEAECKPPKSNDSEVDNDTTSKRTSRRVGGSINLTRCPTIPFSSPAGIVLAKKSKMMTKETQQERLDRIERHVIAPPLSSSCRPKWLDGEFGRDKWIVTYKSNRDKTTDNYVHKYKFPDSLMGKLTLSTSSQLLYTICRPTYVALTRLDKKQIEKLQQDFSKHQKVPRKTLIHKKMTPVSKMTQRQQTGSSPTSAKALRRNSEKSISQLSEEKESKSTETEASTLSVSVDSCSEKQSENVQPIVEKEPCSTEQKSVMVIDLCSSDEEDVDICGSSDENRNPMNSQNNDIKEPILQKFASNICSKACIYPTHSNEWLRENIFSEDNENRSNMQCTNLVIDSCAQITPIFRPTP